MPPTIDEELAMIFREMRRASHLDQSQLCDQLGTSVSVVKALEAGALSSLPSWPETIRVVNAYTRMLGLDPRPILRRIRTQLDASASPQPKELRPQTPADAAPDNPDVPIPDTAMPQTQALPSGQPAAESSSPTEVEVQPAPTLGETVEPRSSADAGMTVDEAPRPRHRIIARVVNWIFVLALCGGLGYAISHAMRSPDRIVEMVEGLPEPIPSAARLLRDIVMSVPGGKAPDSGQTAPQNEKSDRLPQDQAPAIR